MNEQSRVETGIRTINRGGPKLDCAMIAALLLTGMGLFGLTEAQTAKDPGQPAGAQYPADKPADRASQELAAQERNIDVQHLQRIYKAIQAYYADHKDLPNWLSDLVPQYLPNAGDLVSPVEMRTGKSVLFGREDPRIHTSYIYEFNAGPAAEEFNRGRAVPLSCKEWKLMQIGKFGLVTPILRCHLETPVLNVAYSGEIYETGLLWEDDPRTAALVKKNPALGPQKGQPPGPRLAVHIVDADSGEPIPDAGLRSALGSEFGLLPPQQTAADSNGNAGIPLGDWKVNFVFLNASHPQYQTAGFEWNRQKTAEEASRRGDYQIAAKNH